MSTARRLLSRENTLSNEIDLGHEPISMETISMEMVSGRCHWKVDQLNAVRSRLKSFVFQCSSEMFPRKDVSC